MIIVISVVLLVLFFIGCTSITTAIYTSHFFMSRPQLQALINHTRKQFIVLITFVLSSLNPCEIEISWDDGPADQIRTLNGDLFSSFKPNSVVILNHQIYTDWLFLWFLSYTSNLADSVHIVLKDMSKIPVLGYGMRMFDFMFLSRKWELDKRVLTNQLLRIDANARGLGPANGVTHVASANTTSSEMGLVEWPSGENPNEIWPYQVIIFPEGTVPSDRTRGRSAEYTQQLGLPAVKHVLLPRVRGLFLTLRKLRNTAEVVYDFTTAYDGVRADEYGEIVFSLKNQFLRAKGPRKVHYYVRQFALADIPLGTETADIDNADPRDLEAFQNWVYDVWYDKDKKLSEFYATGSFLAKHRTSGAFRLRSNWEVPPVFIPILLVLLLLRVVYLALRALFRV